LVCTPSVPASLATGGCSMTYNMKIEYNVYFLGALSLFVSSTTIYDFKIWSKIISCCFYNICSNPQTVDILNILWYIYILCIFFYGLNTSYIISDAYTYIIHFVHHRPILLFITSTDIENPTIGKQRERKCKTDRIFSRPVPD